MANPAPSTGNCTRRTRLPRRRPDLVATERRTMSKFIPATPAVDPVIVAVEADTAQTVDPGPRASLIDYPSDFPIKIMGPAAEGYAQTIVEVVKRFDPGFDAATLEMRPSA